MKSLALLLLAIVSLAMTTSCQTIGGSGGGVGVNDSSLYRSQDRLFRGQ